MTQKPRVVFWNNIPSPYLVARLNAVTAAGNIDIEAWFNAERTEMRSWKVDPTGWLFRARYIPQRGLLGRTFNLPFAELRDYQPDVMISLFDRPQFAISSFAARVTAGRTAYRALPSYDTWSKRTWYGELTKNILFRMLDGAIVPGPTGREQTMRYGLPADRSYDVTQTIDVAQWLPARQMPTADRDRRRAELGLSGCVFVYVGRLWSGKGLDDLVNAFRTVQAQHADVSLLLIGDGPEEDRYRQMTADLNNVVFTGFVQGDELPTYYALADVSVFPTLGDPHGLVVEEALAAGLPVIATENAGDIRLRLPEGEAGYVVPIQDAVTLANRMLRLASDDALRARLAANTLSVVEGKSHDTYVRDFERFIERLLGKPARQSPVALLGRGIGTLLMQTGPAKATPAPYLDVTEQEQIVHA